MTRASQMVGGRSLARSTNACKVSPFIFNDGVESGVGLVGSTQPYYKKILGVLQLSLPPAHASE